MEIGHRAKHGDYAVKALYFQFIRQWLKYYCLINYLSENFEGE